MNPEVNHINWFEISVADLDRAKKFYQDIFAFEQPLQTMSMMGMDMAFFPYDPSSGKVAGGLAKSDMHKPSMDGQVLYLNGNPDLENILSRVKQAGGQVLMPKVKISDDIGYMAFFADTEGNKIGLHSQN